MASESKQRVARPDVGWQTVPHSMTKLEHSRRPKATRRALYIVNSLVHALKG